MPVAAPAVPIRSVFQESLLRENVSYFAHRIVRRHHGALELDRKMLRSLDATRSQLAVD